jgi:hypothetical protein
MHGHDTQSNVDNTLQETDIIRSRIIAVPAPIEGIIIVLCYTLYNNQYNIVKINC